MTIIPTKVKKTFSINLTDWTLPLFDDAIDKSIRDIQSDLEKVVEKIEGDLRDNTKEFVKKAASEALDWAINDEEMMVTLEPREGSITIVMSLPIGEEDGTPEWEISFEELTEDACKWCSTGELVVMLGKLSHIQDQVRSAILTRQSHTT